MDLSRVARPDEYARRSGSPALRRSGGDERCLSSKGEHVALRVRRRHDCGGGLSASSPSLSARIWSHSRANGAKSLLLLAELERSRGELPGAQRCNLGAVVANPTLGSGFNGIGWRFAQGGRGGVVAVIAFSQRPRPAGVRSTLTWTLAERRVTITGKRGEDGLEETQRCDRFAVGGIVNVLIKGHAIYGEVGGDHHGVAILSPRRRRAPRQRHEIIGHRERVDRSPPAITSIAVAARTALAGGHLGVGSLASRGEVAGAPTPQRARIGRNFRLPAW